MTGFLVYRHVFKEVKPARADGTVRLKADGRVGRCQILNPFNTVA
jgi:hypothetical protein